MPMPGALTSPFGNDQNNLASDIPTDPSGGQAAASAPQPKMGQAPAAPQAGAPQQPESNPFLQPMSPQQQDKLKGMADGTKNPFEEMDPKFPTGYKPIASRLRQNPHGDLEVLHGEGDKAVWAPMGDTELGILTSFQDLAQKWGIRAKEDLPRFVGAMTGGLAGEFMGGTPGMIAGSAGGQAVGGYLANKLSGQPTTPGSVATDVLSGAAGAAIPAGVGKYLAEKAASYAAEAEIAPLVKAGGQALVQKANERLGAAQELNLPIRPDQINLENVGMAKRVQNIMMGGGPEAQKLAQAQALQKQMLLEKRDYLVEKLQGPYQSDVGDQASNFSDVFGKILDNHEQAIGSLKQKAFAASKGQVYDVDPVLSTMREKVTDSLKRNIFTDQGRINPDLLDEAKQFYGGLPEVSKPLIGDYMRLQNASMTGRNLNEVGAFKNASEMDQQMLPVASQPGTEARTEAGDFAPPKKTAGLTLEEMDYFRKKFGDSANFQKGGMRSDTEKAYGEIYYSARVHQDDKMIKALQSVDPTSTDAAKLMAHKDFYSTYKEEAQDFQGMVEHDPSNAASALVDGKDPAKVKNLLSILDDKQKSYLAGGYLDNLTKPLIDPVNGKVKITPVNTQWQKIDPKVKEMLFGDDVKKIDALINYSKAIEARDVSQYDPRTDSMTQKALGAIRSFHHNGSLDFVSGLFQKNGVARDYITGEASDILMPAGHDMNSLAKKQVFMNQASKAVLSKPARVMSQMLGAEVATPNREEPSASTLGGSAGGQ